MAEKLLELRGVSMAFGGLKVVDDLDLHVDEGEIVSVIGPNGAGKTTLFNLITGVYEPTDGDIVFAGASIKGLEPHKITAAWDRAHVPDAAAVPQHERARERDGGRLRPHEGGRLPLDAAHARACGARSRRSASSPRSGSRSSASG